jgi:hypothetical protein
MAMQNKLAIQDGWREQEGRDAKKYTHVRFEEQSNSKKTNQVGANKKKRKNQEATGQEAEKIIKSQSRLDFILGPNQFNNSQEMEIEYGHDHAFWQAPKQADHTGTWMHISINKKEPTDDDKTHIDPKIFSMKEWLEIQDSLWQQHIITQSQNHSKIQFWEKWKEMLALEAAKYTHNLQKAGGKSKAKLTKQMEWLADFQAQHPKHSQVYKITKRFKQQLEENNKKEVKQQADNSLSYGINLADSMHPAFLRQTNEKTARTVIRRLHTCDKYFPKQYESKVPKTLTGQVADNEQICKEVEKFFKQLYKYERPDLDASQYVKAITAEGKVSNPQICEGPATTSEIKRIIESGKTNKVPGPDHIPMEYYKSHFREIGKFLVEYYNEIHKQGYLPDTLKMGIICLT